jgi:hypothetical protein
MADRKLLMKVTDKQKLLPSTSFFLTLYTKLIAGFLTGKD